MNKAAEIFQDTHHHDLPVVDNMGKLRAMLTLQDLDRVPAEKWKTITAGQAGSHDLVVTYPDKRIGAALRRMAVRDFGRLPVVDRQDPDHLLGLLRRTDLVRAYNIALTRREAMRQHAQQVRLGASTAGAQVIEVTVQPGSACDRQKMSTIPWPRDCLVASLRRGGRMLIPHGRTILMPGDVLLVVTEPAVQAEIEALCTSLNV